MSVYCANCGAKNEDGAAFCGNCGAKMERILGAEEQHSKKPIVPILAGVVLVVLVVLLLGQLFQGYKKPLNMLVKGLNKQDEEMIVEAMCRGTDTDTSDALEELDDYGIDLVDRFESMINSQLDESKTVKIKNMKFSCKVVDKDEYDNVDDWQDEHKSSYMIGTLYRRKDVDKVYELTVDLTVKYEGKKTDGKETITLENIFAVKYNGKWSLYLDDMDIDD